METVNHLEKLATAGLSVQVMAAPGAEARLRLSPAAAITAELRAYVVQHKREIVAELQSAGTATDAKTEDLHNGNRAPVPPCALGACAVEPEPNGTLFCDPEGRPWPKIDLRASGAFLHKEINRIRRELRIFPDSEQLTRAYASLCDRINEYWSDEQFKKGWYYG